MANRFPLIVNSGSNAIQELAAGDNLDLTSSGITGVGDINSVGVITATSLVVGSATTINSDGINVPTGIVTALSFSGSGTNISGIVTSIVAGSNISISGSTGQVTVTNTGPTIDDVTALSIALG